MRKDKGLNGDADRLPMLTWIMFLKFLDDAEELQETEALLHNKDYKPTIASPYRWRDWAKNTGLTGDDLLAFINNEQTTLPDGTVGQGLFYYLRGLQSESGKSRQEVIATVFRGVANRMINGYLLRDVVAKIDAIHFNSTEEIYTLSHLYESILKEMRDASGDAGETENAWPVAVTDILQYDNNGRLLAANLDRKNPNRKSENEYVAPAVAVASILQKEHRILELMTEIEELVNNEKQVLV